MPPPPPPGVIEVTRGIFLPPKALFGPFSLLCPILRHCTAVSRANVQQARNHRQYLKLPKLPNVAEEVCLEFESRGQHHPKLVVTLASVNRMVPEARKEPTKKRSEYPQAGAIWEYRLVPGTLRSGLRNAWTRVPDVPDLPCRPSSPRPSS
jgi:hypothetical protein